MIKDPKRGTNYAVAIGQSQLITSKVSGRWAQRFNVYMRPLGLLSEFTLYGGYKGGDSLSIPPSKVAIDMLITAHHFGGNAISWRSSKSKLKIGADGRYIFGFDNATGDQIYDDLIVTIELDPPPNWEYWHCLIENAEGSPENELPPVDEEHQPDFS